MVNRLLLGRYNNGTTYGMKLSIPGHDVLTAEGDKLIFDTQWLGAGTIHQTGVTTIGNVVNFPPLSYIPMVYSITYGGTGQTFDAYWTERYPESRRWATEYTTRYTAGLVYQVNAGSIYYPPLPSGFTTPATNVRYFVFRIPGV